MHECSNWLRILSCESELMKNGVVGDSSLNRYHLLTLTLCQTQSCPKHIISSTLEESTPRLVSEVARGEITGFHRRRHSSPGLSGLGSLYPHFLRTTELQQGNQSCFLHTHTHVLLRMGTVTLGDKFGVENSPFTKLLVTPFLKVLTDIAMRHFNSQHWKGYAIRAQECWKSPKFPLPRSPRRFSGLSLLRLWKGKDLWKTWLKSREQFPQQTAPTGAPGKETGASNPQ